MKIATVSGIPVRLHWSFLALVAGYGLFSLVGGGLFGLVDTLVLAIVLFGSVILHELGHAMAARVFHIQTAHITLYPFGGVAAIKGEPSTPFQELVIAIAGPAVNFALFAMLLPLALIAPIQLIVLAAGINLIMGVFNLVPAFPMDGGRVLRAALTPFLGWWRASTTAIAIGRLFAIAFLLIGLVAGWPSLMLVGGFVLFATFAERQRLTWMRRQAEDAYARGFVTPTRYSRPKTPSWRLNPPRSAL